MSYTLGLPASEVRFTDRAGVLDIYPGSIGALYPRSASERAFTYELSGHLPPWAELEVRLDAGRTNSSIL